LEWRCVPATITPTTFADGGLGSGSLRDAVLQFNADPGTDDDIIQLEAGTYSLTIRNAGNRHETAGLTGDLNLTQASHRWIIQGAGTSTIIDASQLQDRVFQIVKPGTQVVFQDLVIQGGLTQDDGTDGALAGTTDALGGGVLNNGGDFTLHNVVIQNNVARGGDAVMRGASGHNASGGGIYSTRGVLALAGATLTDNQTAGGRGGDYYSGDGGAAAGGGLYATGGSLDISDSRIANNRATGGRGGDSGSGNGGDGGSGAGGGLYATVGSLDISSSTIASNQATGGAAGLCGTEIGRHATGGPGQGAGLYVSGSSLSIATSTIASNQAMGGPGSGAGSVGAIQGGGLYNAGTLTVTGSTLSDNSATTTTNGFNGNVIGGGGVYNVGTLTVSNSTLSGNSATGARYDGGVGGGIYNVGTLTVSNSTLSSNTATDANYGNGFGGGIFNVGTLTVSNSTLSSNTANDRGGGLYVYTGSPVLHNTLIADNFRGDGTTRDDVLGRLDASGSYNLIGDGTGMTGLHNGVNGNQVGSASAPIDPLLDSLQYNGGSTKTHALLAGSPALNAGNPNQLGVPDQRAVVRSGGVNIGAYQASATAFVLNAPDMVQSGVAFDVSVKAVDPFGQVAVGYLGTVTFSTSDHDPDVVLPADYSFQPSDAGQVTFPGGITLITPGDQTLSVMDTADNSVSGSALITVGGMAPGAGSRGRERQAQPSSLQGSALPTTEPSYPEVVAGDHWFIAFNERDLRFALVPPMYDAWAGGDWWALDSWWGGEPLVT
jgi:hypothetical protein